MHRKFWQYIAPLFKPLESPTSVRERPGNSAKLSLKDTVKEIGEKEQPSRARDPTLKDTVKAILKKAEDEQNRRVELERRIAEVRGKLTPEDVATYQVEDAVEIDVSMGHWETHDGLVGKQDIDATYGDYAVLYRRISGLAVLLDHCSGIGEKEPLRIPVATCDTYLIKPVLPFGFTAAVSQISPTCAKIAQTLFDESGSLQEGFCTSVWQDGFGVERDMLFLEQSMVDVCAQDSRVPSMLLEEVLRQAQLEASTEKHALFAIGPVQFPATFMNDKRGHEPLIPSLHRSIDLFTYLGFRRISKSEYFAWSASKDHPSRKLAATEDEL